MHEDLDLPADVIIAAQSNRRIDAIRLLQEQRDIGLSDARQLVDAYMARNPQLVVEGDDTAGYGRLAAAVVVIALLYLAYRFFT